MLCQHSTLVNDRCCCCIHLCGFQCFRLCLILSNKEVMEAALVKNSSCFAGREMFYVERITNEREKGSRREGGKAANTSPNVLIVCMLSLLLCLSLCLNVNVFSVQSLVSFRPRLKTYILRVAHQYSSLGGAS